MQPDAPAPPSAFIRSKGIKFPKDFDVLIPRIRQALRQNSYETREANAVKLTVRPEDVVLELGGGIGFMSTFVAKKRRVQAIHVFEANPNLVPYIQAVHAANEITQATVYNALLGPVAGTRRFYIRRNILASSLDPRDGDGIVQTAQVPVWDLKETMAKLRPTVLICDIEGAEAQLVPQMDLANLRAAIIELHPQWIGPKGVNAVFEAMMAAGLVYHPRGSQNKVVTFRRHWPMA